MKRIALSLTALMILGAGVSLAQDKGKVDLRRDNQPPGALSTTPVSPEVWLYEQERERYDNPQAMVRRRAEIRGAQRQQRLASMKWYGLSNARPDHTPTPWFGPQSPRWGSNSGHPYIWHARTTPRVVLQVRSNRLY
jgi:hypothetical protein